MRNVVNALVVALILVVAGGLLIVATAKVREAANRSQCLNNLKQIGTALHSYHDSIDHFPRAAEPIPGLPPERRLSWLVSPGPYFEGTDLYVKMDRKRGWDAEENRYLALTVYRLLQCPGYPDQPPVSTLVPTHYVGIAGLGSDAAALPAEDPAAGFFGYERQLTLSDMREGTSTLLVAVETARASGAWTAGGPPTVRGLEEGPPYLGAEGPFGGTHRGGANALFADASVRFLREKSAPRVIRAMVTVGSSAGVGPIGEE
jgi:prepilin-type processing-associated H-X9-DG protein